MLEIFTREVREYVKLWQCLHLPTLFACPYKTFIASLIAFRVAAKGMAAMAGFQAVPYSVVVTVDLVVCKVHNPVLCVA